MPNIPELRLVSQRLLGPGLESAAQIVGHLGAVQSQDYGPAKWGLGLRLTEATDAAIEQDFNDGKFLLYARDATDVALRLSDRPPMDASADQRASAHGKRFEVPSTRPRR